MSERESVVAMQARTASHWRPDLIWLKLVLAKVSAAASALTHDTEPVSTNLLNLAGDIVDLLLSPFTDWMPEEYMRVQEKKSEQCGLTPQQDLKGRSCLTDLVWRHVTPKQN